MERASTNLTGAAQGHPRSQGGAWERGVVGSAQQTAEHQGRTLLSRAWGQASSLVAHKRGRLWPRAKEPAPTRVIGEGCDPSTLSTDEPRFHSPAVPLA